MTEPISVEVRYRIWALIFLGYTRLEIHNMTGVSTGAISAIKKDMTWQLGEDFEVARRFALNVRRTGCSVEDCLIGFRIIMLLKRAGISDLDEVEGCLLDMVEATEGKISDKLQIGKHLMILLELAKKTDLPIDKVPDAIKELLEQRDHLLPEIADLRAQEEVLKKEVKAELASKKATLLNLAHYVIMRSAFARLGIDIDKEPERAINCIENCRDYDYDSKKVTTALSEERLLKARLAQMNNDCINVGKDTEKGKKIYEEQQNQIHKLKQEADALRATSEREAKVRDSMRKLHTLGINDEKIIAIDSIFATSGLNAVETSDEIKKLGGIKKAEEKASQALAEKEFEKEQKSEELKTLQEQRNQLTREKEDCISYINLFHAETLRLNKHTEYVYSLVDKVSAGALYLGPTIKSVAGMEDIPFHALIHGYVWYGDYVYEHAFDRTPSSLRQDFLDLREGILKFNEKVRKHMKDFPMSHRHKPEWQVLEKYLNK